MCESRSPKGEELSVPIRAMRYDAARGFSLPVSLPIPCHDIFSVGRRVHDLTDGWFS
jgi:hypothetical protein